jgi:sugar/nucleoside kinase (ribokinase family)
MVGDLLKRRGCRIGGVTLGEHGTLWYEESGRMQTLPALAVPPAEVAVTNGTGDISPALHPLVPHASGRKGAERFRSARAASAYSARFLGIETSLPTLADIASAQRACREAA